MPSRSEPGVPVVVGERLSKRFFLHHNRTHSLKERFLSTFHSRHRTVSREFWALRDASFRIASGESVGLIGRNGSGKSTLLKLIAGIHRPTGGRLLMRSRIRVGSMIELGVGFHPELTGKENVYLNASIYGMSRPDVDRVYASIVEYSEIGAFIEEPIKNYSSGMSVRLAFAVVAHMDPDLLLLDEVFAVGDAEFQAKCLATMQGFAARGKTMIFVSHSAESIRQMCGRVCVLSHGRLVYDGPTDEGLAAYEEIWGRELQQHAADPSVRELG